MKNAKKKNKPNKYMGEIPITKTPNNEVLAIWYGIGDRGFRKRKKKTGICFEHRVLTEGNYGEIFFRMNIPPYLPEVLRDWAIALVADYVRLVPNSSE